MKRVSRKTAAGTLYHVSIAEIGSPSKAAIEGTFRALDALADAAVKQIATQRKAVPDGCVSCDWCDGRGAVSGRWGHGSSCCTACAGDGFRDPQTEYSALVKYMQVKMTRRDWHGVSDVANDIRVLVAEFPTLEKSCP